MEIQVNDDVTLKFKNDVIVERLANVQTIVVCVDTAKSGVVSAIEQNRVTTTGTNRASNSKFLTRRTRPNPEVAGGVEAHTLCGSACGVSCPERHRSSGNAVAACDQAGNSARVVRDKTIQ